MPDLGPRHHLFGTALQRADWTVQQLWVGYLARGGTEDAFHVEAYLHGLATLAPAQQDVLANAVNERLSDIYLAVRVPYLLSPDLEGAGEQQNPPDAIEELLRPTARNGDT